MFHAEHQSVVYELPEAVVGLFDNKLEDLQQALNHTNANHTTSSSPSATTPPTSFQVAPNSLSQLVLGKKGHHSVQDALKGKEQN